MAVYRVTDPTSGKTVKLTGDSPPTESELNEIFSSIPAVSVKPPSTFKKVMGGLDTITKPLTYPEKAAQYIIPKLTQIQSSIQNKAAQVTGLPIGEEPTGNLARDIIANTPRIMGETAAQTLPSMISRGSILTMGAMKGASALAPLVRAGGLGLAEAAESISGLEYKTPGILAEAANNPKLIFSPGKAKAEYEAAKQLGGEVRKSLSQIPEKMKMVKESLKLAEKGELNPTEALEARKELSALKKTVSGEFFRKATEKFNEVAKPVFGEADKAYRQGVKADALRLLFPVNKGGGTSIAKSALGSIAGVVPMMAMSPAVQGGIATGVGMAARSIGPALSNPAIPAAALTLTIEKAKEFLKKAKGNRGKARKMAEDQGYVIPEVSQ
jgi:hypothetical protein